MLEEVLAGVEDKVDLAKVDIDELTELAVEYQVLRELREWEREEGGWEGEEGERERRERGREGGGG